MNGIQEVSGSIPLISTKQKHRGKFSVLLFFCYQKSKGMRPWSHALWQSYLILRSFRIRDTLSDVRCYYSVFLLRPRLMRSSGTQTAVTTMAAMIISATPLVSTTDISTPRSASRAEPSAAAYSGPKSR